MGICDRATGICDCAAGFEGSACERQKCHENCYGVGECQSMYLTARNKNPGEGTVYKYNEIWDAQKIYGCSCDSRYHGYDCGWRKCPFGDDPLTGTTDISDSENPTQYNDIQRVSCRANGGTFTLQYKGKFSININHDAVATKLQAHIEAIPTVGKIKLVMNGPQACSDNGKGNTWTIEFLDDFGSLPLMVVDARKLYHNGAFEKLLTVVKFVDGTKEMAECSNRGICDTQSGVCTCSNDWDTSNGYNQPGSRGDCGYTPMNIQYCPGEIACSAHGNCRQNPTYTCECLSGWTGGDCSEQLCTTALAWFSQPEGDNLAHLSEYAECANAGTCDRNTGTCICNTGHTGAACDRLACPGQTEDTDACHGHGTCLDMSTLATYSRENGVVMGYTYGLMPNKAETWDAFRIFGCHCDEQYMGYDCSLMVCPFGDNPDTSNQLDERQILSCTDDGVDGTIVLTFREAVSEPILPSATRDDVKAALEALSTINEVAVDTWSTGAEDKLCTVGGNQFTITFLTEHDDLPMLQFTAPNIALFDIHEYQAGTKENKRCSDRGLCDHSTGECECIQGYGSSDGMGGAGTLRDCGYVLPFGGL